MELGHHSPTTEVSEAYIQEANKAYTRSERSSLKSFYGVTVLSPGSNLFPSKIRVRKLFEIVLQTSKKLSG